MCFFYAARIILWIYLILVLPTLNNTVNIGRIDCFFYKNELLSTLYLFFRYIFANE